VALNVAPAILCATKPTWNTKQRLERQQEQEWRREQQREQHHFRYIGRRVGLVDSASEKNKARAVIEIYFEPGVIHTLLAPFRYH